MPEELAAPDVLYRDIHRLPGYRFGDEGSIWSRRMPGWVVRFDDTWHRLTPVRTKAGRYQVRLTIDGVTRTYLVHRLILEAFRGPCPDGMEACHDDGNPGNNRLSNLRWGTHLENMADQRRHGTAPDRNGPKNPNAKLTDADLLLIPILRREGRSCAQIATILGVSFSTIVRSSERAQVRRRGSTNHKAKLAEADIPAIRELRSKGWSYPRIGELYGVNASTIRSADSGKSWSHVPRLDCHLDAVAVQAEQRLAAARSAG